MNWNPRYAILFLAFMLICAGLAFSATQNAVIYGTVYNSGGNAMPNVTVQLENRALGFSRTTTTGSDGSYNFAEVPPADGYMVTAKQGPKTLDVRAGITVNVGDERVILPPLTEQIVAATGPSAPREVKPAVGKKTVQLETVSTAVSGVVTGDQLRSLPLYNRNFLSLGLITPNVHDTEAGSSLTGASFSVTGNRPSENNFLLDGADNVASSSNQAVPFQVNDAIQEFRVISSTASAEYGRGQGGVVNVVTRRGGNAFHGSAFGYFGSDALNADNPLSLYNGTTFDKAAAYAGPVNATAATFSDPQFFSPFSYNQFVANAQAGMGFASGHWCTDSIRSAGSPSTLPAVNGATQCNQAGFTGLTGLNTRFDPAKVLQNSNEFKQPFSSQQFGLNMGGAIVKDKLFVFGSYEGTRIDNPNPILERVPSTFDKTLDPLGAGYTFASGLGAADPNYAINHAILGLFPASNINSVGSGAVPDVLEFYQGQAPNYTHVHNLLFRSDYIRSDKSSFGMRYAAQFLNQLHDDSLPEQSIYPGNGAVRDAFNQNLNLTFSHRFSNSVINEASVGFNRFDVGESAQDASFDATTLGLPFRQMPTILLNGLDAQYSGQTPAGGGNFGQVGAAASGAFTTYIDCCNQLPWGDYRFPMARIGAPLNAPSERRDTTWFLTDNLSWSYHRHSIKFGADFRRLDNDLFNGAFNRGLVYSSNIGEFTSDSESCNGLCNGNAFQRPTFDFAQFNPTYSGKFSSWALAGYIQDTWRVHPRITVNMGLRYE